jgi:ATP-dependent DNA helicase RecQ
LVTPLLALARQQSAKLRALGISVSLGSGSEGFSRLSQESQVWILSPEKLLQRSTRLNLSRFDPRFWVVDECHCLWDWGDRFRPAFQQIPEVMASLRVKRSLWLTATLPPEGRHEILSRLPKPKQIIGDFQFPPSLEFQVVRVPWGARIFKILEFIQEARGTGSSGILFASTRENSEKYKRLLHASGIEARAYHAGMSKEERLSTERWVEESGSFRVVCATSAFGMGMDFSGLHWVILSQPPSSLLSLAQAIGRVGRAGVRGRAILFWDEVDLHWLDRVGLSERAISEFNAVAQFLKSSFIDTYPGQSLEEYFNRKYVSSLGF